MMNLRILRALLVKEVTLMRRNPLIPKIIFVMPLMVMLIIPLVANLDVSRVEVCVTDNDHTQTSRRIIADISATEALTVSAICDTRAEAMQKIERGEADVLLTIPAGFSKDMAAGEARADIEANGVNATKGMLGARYLSEAVTDAIARLRASEGIETAMPEVSVVNRYNPTLDFRNYMIPALMVVLLIIICGFLPALNLVSEKEEGTIEAINVTPVGRLTFVLSKLIPFWVAGLLVVTVGMLVGWLVYGLIPAGSIAAIYLAAILFSLVMSGLGVAIANSSSTMLQSIFVMFAIIMVFQLMSGLFTPIRSMPAWAQAVTYAIPPRYFIEIMRSVYLKATPVSELWMQYTLLLFFAATLSAIAALTYRKQQ